MLLLVAAAYAHPQALPHVHSADDPSLLALLGVWTALGLLLLVLACRPAGGRQRSNQDNHPTKV